jgi:hypothetical protein
MARSRLTGRPAGRSNTTTTTTTTAVLLCIIGRTHIAPAQYLYY